MVVTDLAARGIKVRIIDLGQDCLERNAVCFELFRIDMHLHCAVGCTVDIDISNALDHLQAVDDGIIQEAADFPRTPCVRRKGICSDRA